MYRILDLSNNDFSRVEVSPGKIIIRARIAALSLITFHSHMEPVSTAFMMTFQQLPRMVEGCRFAAINISKYPQIIRMTQGTLMPVNEVPYIIICYDGIPKYRYKGAHTIQAIKDFVMVSAREIIAKQITVNHLTGPPLPEMQERMKRDFNPQTRTDRVMPQQSKLGGSGPLVPYPQQKSQNSGKGQIYNVDPTLSAWSTGIPIYGDGENVSYIEFSDLDKLEFKTRPTGKFQGKSGRIM